MPAYAEISFFVIFQLVSANKKISKVQQGKFKQFKAFWNEKEQELKEIDFQLQKVCTS